MILEIREAYELVLHLPWLFASLETRAQVDICNITGLRR